MTLIFFLFLCDKKICHWLIKVNIATFIISGNDVFRGRRIIKNTSQSISRISLLSFVLFQIPSYSQIECFTSISIYKISENTKTKNTSLNLIKIFILLYELFLSRHQKQNKRISQILSSLLIKISSVHNNKRF